MDQINKITSDVVNTIQSNPYSSSMMALILSVMAGHTVLPTGDITQILKSPIVKFAIYFLIAFQATNDATVAAVVAVGFFVLVSQWNKEGASNTDTHIKKKCNIVMFYAPWCGWSKKAIPDFEKAMNKYASHDTIHFAMVDCTSASGDNTCKIYGVNSFPTIKHLDSDGNEKVTHSGSRDFESLCEFAESANAS